MRPGYSIKRIKDICDKGSSNIAQKDLEGHDGEYPIYGASGFIKNVDFYHQDTEYVGIVKDGSGIGRVAFYPPKSSLIGTLQYILPKPEYDIRYVGYCLQSLDLSSYRQGAAIPHIYFRDYGEREVFVAKGIQEQQRIVDILDQEFAKIDALKANAEKSLQAAEDLFLHLSNGFFELSFPVSKLGNECDFVRGPFGGSLKKSCFKPSGYPVYEQQHAIYSRFTFRYFVDEDKFKEMRRFSVLPGDLIMSCSGTIGKVAIIPDDAPVGIINQALLKLTTKERLLPEYLKWYMQSLSFENAIQKHSKGAAIQNVASVAVLKEITIPVPPIEQQRKIVVGLDDLNDRCNILQDNHKKTIALCEDLKQAVLRKAFNGEL